MVFLGRLFGRQMGPFMMTEWLVLMSPVQEGSGDDGGGEEGERRKLALGDCGRADGTDCAHEDACVQCPVLIVHASERPRPVEIEGLRRCRCRRA